MFSLELKIPPVLLTLIFAALMWALYRITPGFPIPQLLKNLLPALLGVAALAVGSAGVQSFRRAKTTVNPMTPDACSSLVISGIFRFTRNPMYVALLLFLIAWGIFLANIYSLALIVIYFVYLNRFQIRPEERALEAVFGAEYLDYMKRVRRWF